MGEPENPVVHFTIPEGVCLVPASLGYFGEVSYDDRDSRVRVWDEYADSTKLSPDCTITDAQVVLPASSIGADSIPWRFWPYYQIVDDDKENVCITYAHTADNLDSSGDEYEVCSKVPPIISASTCGNAWPICVIDLQNNEVVYCEQSVNVEVLAEGSRHQALVELSANNTQEFANYQGFQVDLYYPSSVDDWALHIGDSITNNGYAGDSNTQHYDAELQFRGNEMRLYGNDFTTPGSTIDGHRLLKSTKNFGDDSDRLSVCVGNEYVSWANNGSTP